MLVYNLIPICHLLKMFAALIRPTHLCCCLIGMLGADYIKKLFSMHFYTNCAL